ncbi:hypothetical protein BLNAU_5173 [Blattamonas nauphoetae]|uniref:Uncharacterized protein n=1 Tax=Blattamonas nauphoetae TaxID=2049346 RepID=A0ABQ9Y8E4_9EUKA|nr:hypothetical protein BLNAU_5173 [Blattamonas nauphoetae]
MARRSCRGGRRGGRRTKNSSTKLTLHNSRLEASIPTNANWTATQHIPTSSDSNGERVAGGKTQSNSCSQTSNQSAMTTIFQRLLHFSEIFPSVTVQSRPFPKSEKSRTSSQQSRSSETLQRLQIHSFQLSHASPQHHLIFCCSPPQLMSTSSVRTYLATKSQSHLNFLTLQQYYLLSEARCLKQSPALNLHSSVHNGEILQNCRPETTPAISAIMTSSATRTDNSHLSQHSYSSSSHHSLIQIGKSCLLQSQSAFFLMMATSSQTVQLIHLKSQSCFQCIFPPSTVTWSCFHFGSTFPSLS